MTIFKRSSIFESAKHGIKSISYNQSLIVISAIELDLFNIQNVKLGNQVTFQFWNSPKIGHKSSIKR